MKKIIILTLLFIIPTNCETMTSQNFWKDQTTTVTITKKRTIFAQTLAAISCYGIATYLYRDNRPGRRLFVDQSYLKDIAFLGSILTGLTFYAKTIVDLKQCNFGNKIYYRGDGWKLLSYWNNLSKDLIKLGIEKEAATQLAHFLIFYSKTLAAKQIVTEKLKEHLLSEADISYIIEKFFGDTQPIYPTPLSSTSINATLKTQNIKNIQFYYQMYPWEAEYIAEKYYTFVQEETLSPLAGKFLQLKLQKKFPNHPILELFSFE